ncbi:cupin [Sphingomonas sp. BK235]|nr:cupin [Sphingomonas sp. BK235]
MGLALCGAATMPAPGSAQTSDATPPGFADAARVRTQVAAMLAEMRPDQGFMWRPLVGDGTNVAAIEIWKKPGRPALHPSEAEYAMVVEGKGTLVSGGTLARSRTSKPGLVEGETIEGGSSRALAPGDVILIPAGVPHWFGITGERLVLLGMKVPGRR